MNFREIKVNYSNFEIFSFVSLEEEEEEDEGGVGNGGCDSALQQSKQIN